MTRHSIQLKAILFDLDGTLIDSAECDILIMKRIIQEDLGFDPDPEDLKRYNAMSSSSVMEEIAPDRIKELIQKYATYLEEMRGRIRLFPGIESMLSRFKHADFKLAVITAQNRIELDVTRRYINLEPWIDVWVSLDDVQQAKPHPAPVIEALRLLNIAARHAIMIGDTPYDLQAGRKAGTLTGAALWGSMQPRALRSLNPDFVFEKPQQLDVLLKPKRPPR